MGHAMQKRIFRIMCEAKAQISLHSDQGLYGPLTESLDICLFVWFELNVAFNNLSVISRQCLDVTGSSMLTFRVLSHWNIMPQTLWHDISPRHIKLTLSWPDPIPSSTFFNAERQAKEQLVPFLKSLVWPGRGSNIGYYSMYEKRAKAWMINRMHRMIWIWILRLFEDTFSLDAAQMM